MKCIYYGTDSRVIDSRRIEDGSTYARVVGASPAAGNSRHMNGRFCRKRLLSNGTEHGSLLNVTKYALESRAPQNTSTLTRGRSKRLCPE